MKEVEQHWEPNLTYRCHTSEDPKTVELTVTAEYDDDTHDVGGVHIHYKPLAETVIRVWGIIEYVAHALKESQALVLIHCTDHILSVKDADVV